MAETLYYTHDYENDTTYTFEPGNTRSQITMTYTSEDPDFGTETLVYGGDGNEKELARELLSDLSRCLDMQENPPRFARAADFDLQYYDNNYSRTSLIAFEAMLLEITE